MLKFYRRIRRKLLDEGNLRKYIIYGIGEILLVMIGILLALQVNNINESRRAKQLKLKYINALKSDLEKDIKSIKDYNDQNSYYEGLGQKLLNSLQGNSVKIDSQIIYEALVYANFKPSYSITSSTYNDLISSGKLALFEDMELKRLLDNYFIGNDWDKKFDERITQSLWYDYWDERLKYIDASLLKDFRESQQDGIELDLTNYKIDFYGMKSSNSFMQQLKIVIYLRKVIRNVFFTKKEQAKALLEYLQKTNYE